MGFKAYYRVGQFEGPVGKFEDIEPQNVRNTQFVLLLGGECNKSMQL